MLAWNDIETTRQLFGAVLGMALFLVTAPKGRRWLARSPAIFLLLSPLPVVLPVLFPSAPSAGWIRSTNNTFSFIGFFVAVIASRFICFFMRASKKSNS